MNEQLPVNQGEIPLLQYILYAGRINNERK